MSEHVVREAAKELNVLFNLMALKHKCLLPNHKCNNCKQFTKNWVVIQVCHHILCNECVNIDGKEKHCPVCNIKFNPKKHVKNINDMKISYSEIEEIVFNVMAAENGTSDALYCEKEEDNNVEMLDVVSTETIESTQSKGSSEQININAQVPNSPYDKVLETNLSEELNYDKKCNGNIQDCFNSNGKELSLAIHENSGNSSMESKIKEEIKSNLTVKMLDVVFTKTIEPPQDEDISVLTSCNSNSKEILNGNVQDCFNSSKEREPLMMHENSNNNSVESIIKNNVELKSSIKFNDLSLNSKENNLITIKSSQDIIEQTDYNSESSNDLFDGIEEIAEASYLELPNLKHSFVSDSNIEMSEEIINVNEERNNLETISLQERKHDNHNMSTEQDIEGELSSSDGSSSSNSGSDDGSYYSTSNSESEEDVIEGTPNRSQVSNSLSKQKNNKIVVTYSNVKSDEELDVLRELINVFDIHAHTEWSDKITHLVVKTWGDNYCMRTRKYMNAILANCYIVNFDWAKDSLNSKTLLSEDGYIPLDMSGEQSPLMSWRVGRGIIESPMEWTKTCILFFHSSVKTNQTYSNIARWAKKARFNIANDIEELKSEEYKIRIVLVFSPESDVPSESEIKTWMTEYKAVTLYMEWFLECLFRYRFIEISPCYPVLKIDPNAIEFMDIDKSLFQFE